MTTFHPIPNSWLVWIKLNLKFVFGLLISKLLDSKVINSYKSLDSSYNISIDGTGHYSSATVHCDNCCVKNHKDGTVTYYHNALCAVIVNPDQKTVFPIGVEAIKKMIAKVMQAKD